MDPRIMGHVSVECQYEHYVKEQARMAQHDRKYTALDKAANIVEENKDLP